MNLQKTRNDYIEEMIPNKVYDEVLNNYSNKKEIAKKNNIPLCFLYNRLAKEGRIDYNSEDYQRNIEKID